MIAMLAGNITEYYNYCGSTETDKRIFYVKNRESLYGINIDDFIVVGTFWDRKDAGDLYRLAMERKRPETQTELLSFFLL